MENVVVITLFKMPGVRALLLIAFAGIGAAANADTAVTLYGLIDQGISFQKINGSGTRMGVDSGLANQSRFGLRGTEDLGGGYKATFRLEGGFSGVDGRSEQDRFYGRQATVGIEGDAGGITLGRQEVLGRAWGADVASPFGVSWSENAAGTTFGYDQGDFGSGGRMDNTVLYESPTISGFQAAVGYSFAVDPGAFRTDRNNRVITSGLRYAGGPLELVVTYDMLRPAAGADGATRRTRNLEIGAAYDFEIVKVHAGFNDQRGLNQSSTENFVEAGHHDDRVYTAGVSVPVGAVGEVLASYQHATQSKTRVSGLAYRHSLSKRTFAYVLANYVDTIDHDTGDARDQRRLSVGLQHKF